MNGEATPNGRAAGSDATSRSRVADAIEVIALILTGYVCHLYYNLIGHLSSLRGVDYGPWFLTPVDRAIPYAPVWVHAYQIAYFMPGAVLLLLVARLGFNATAVRRILFAFLSLLFTHYALYLTLPTSAASVRLDDAAIGAGTLADLVRYQYRLATIWCAWPSLHVSACWFFYRLLRRHYRGISWGYVAWFGAMLVGTVAIKIHYVADGITGLMLGEGAWRLFARLEAIDALAWRWRSDPLRVTVHLGIVLALAVGIPIVMRGSGFAGPLYAVGIAK